MKEKLLKLLLLTILLMPFKAYAIATNAAYDNIKVYLFYEDDCEDCDSFKNTLEDILKDRKRIRSEYIDVNSDKKLYEEVKNFLEIKKDNMPLIVIGSDYFFGDKKKTEENLTAAIEAYEDANEYCDAVSKLKNGEDTKECLKQNEDIYNQPVNLALYIAITSVCIVVIIGIVIVLKLKKKTSKAK